jgi:hypothetical protein
VRARETVPRALPAARRLAVAAALLALGLAGCPIPQPLPDYPAGTVTPPRIRMDEMIPETDGNPIIFVPAGCATPPTYTLGGSVSDSNTIERIEARWFVNYDPRYSLNYNWLQRSTILPNADTTDLIRTVPSFTFTPYDFGPSPGAPSLTHSNPPFPEDGVLRVVELVVSNGFDPAPITTTSELPNKKPSAGSSKFETQTYRWVFLSVPQSASVTCP